MMNHGGPGCHVERLQPRTSSLSHTHTETAILAVAGMGCVNCANRVYNGLVGQFGVVYAEVDLESASATVEYDPARTGLGGLINAVERAGRMSGHMYRAALARGT